MRISWTVPANLGGDGIAISRYRILLRQADLTFSEAALGTGCNPSDATAAATIVSNNYCDLEMSVLRSAPFNLTQSAQILAKVQA